MSDKTEKQKKIFLDYGWQMRRVSRSNCRGFTLIEVLIVITIVSMMTGVVFSVANRDRGPKEVEAAANQVVSILRGLQNDAINGKLIDGDPVCEFIFQPTTAVYLLTENDCGSPPENLLWNSFEFANNNGNNRIKISGSTISFKAPRGEVSAGSIMVTNGTDSHYVCVVGGGAAGGSNIYAKKTGCP